MKKGRWKIFLSGLVSLKWDHGIPRLFLIDRFEKPVRYTIWSLTVLSIISSVFIFPAWYYALGFSVIIAAVIWFVQRTVLQFTSLYITPMPTFEFKGSDWTAMGFGFSSDRKGRPDMLMPAFASDKLAKDFMDLLLQWNYNQHEDEINNVCVSIIFESDKSYSCYIYPNPKRPSVSEFQAVMKEEGAHKHPGKKHMGLVAMMTFCKWFPYDENSNVLKFCEVHQPGDPFDMYPAVYTEDAGTMTLVSDTLPLRKWDLKVKHRSELQPKEYEYEYRRQRNRPLDSERDGEEEG